MIRKLRHRFILFTMAGIGFVFMLILLALNIFMTMSATRQGYEMLENYADRRTTFEEKPSPPFRKERGGPNEWFNDMRIFYASFDEEGNSSESSLGNNPNLTKEELLSMADKILQNPDGQGRISGYLYLYREDAGHQTVYFLDYTPEKDTSARLFRICLWVGLGGILFILIPVILLSRWVTKPVQLAFDKQKQFIADASHELKTPLTIITTNAEVLQGSLPDNKWLSHILEQSDRMKKLINSLLQLAKLDSYNEKLDFYSFDLSQTVRNAALSFESLAFEYGKQFQMEIEEGLPLYGNEERIRQLVTILLDNAFKYSDENGSVLIRLRSCTDKPRRLLFFGHPKAQKELLVQNSGKGISAKDQKHIFERFYRSDVSRSRESGGYGLGLSIAQSIVLTHRGSIQVKSDGKSGTSFYVTLP